MKINTEYINTFNITVVLSIALAIMIIMAGGFILYGILMGVMATLAIWLTFSKLPERVQGWAVQNKWTILATDLVLTKLTVAVIVLIGTGPTVFMAIVTQMVLLGLLLDIKGREFKESSWKKTDQSSVNQVTQTEQLVNV